MQLAYGAKRLTAGTASVMLREQYERNRADQILSTERVVDVRGELQVTSQSASVATAQADLKQQLDALRASLLVQQQDLIFYQDSGAEALSLKNAESITGVQISDVNFLEEQDAGTEFANKVTYSFRATAKYPAPGSDTLLVEYRETSEFGGGDPVIIVARGINGVNQEQMIYPIDEYFCTVNGEASGYKNYPAFPKKPGVEWKARYGYRSPERHGKGYTTYPITWSFERHSAVPVVYIPRKWIGA